MVILPRVISSFSFFCAVFFCLGKRTHFVKKAGSEGVLCYICNLVLCIICIEMLVDVIAVTLF